MENIKYLITVSESAQQINPIQGKSIDLISEFFSIECKRAIKAERLYRSLSSKYLRPQFIVSMNKISTLTNVIKIFTNAD